MQGRAYSRVPGLRALAALSLLPLAGACASLDGQAKPMLEVAAVTAVAAKYPPATALATFYGRRNDEAAQRAWRDEVIGAYLAAADLRYLEFRRDLSRQMKGSGLGLDIAVLGLTGGASLAAGKTANALSAIAAGFAGTRATLSKELWFDKTLPALVAAMDAQRTQVRVQILTRMQASPAAYSLAEAFADIARYQEAATLDSAIELVTAAASEKSVQADARYASVVLSYSGAPPAGSPQTKADLKLKLEGVTTPGKLTEIAKALNITLPAGATDQDALRLIKLKIANAATLQDLDTITDTVNASLGGN